MTLRPSDFLAAVGVLVLGATSSGCAGTQLASFGTAMDDARAARCATALCFGDENEYAVEPVVELPVGKTFALSARSDGLPGYYDNNRIDVSFNAGIRFWALHDVASLTLYLSEPVVPSQSTLRIQGSEFEHPPSAVRRPWPGLALGLFADTLWLGVDYNELRNGGRVGGMDIHYRPNQRIDSVVSLTVAIAPVNAIRTGLGTALTQNRRKAEEKQAADAKVFEEQISGANLERKALLEHLLRAERDTEVARVRRDDAKAALDGLAADADPDERTRRSDALAAATTHLDRSTLERDAFAAEVAASDARLAALQAQRAAAAAGRALDAAEQALITAAEDARKAALTARAKVLARADPAVAADGEAAAQGS